MRGVRPGDNRLIVPNTRGAWHAPKNDRFFGMTFADPALVGSIGPAAKPAIRHLLQVLREKSNPTASRQRAVWALGQIDVDGQEVMPVLIETLKDEDELVGLGATLALHEVGAEAKAAVPALTEALKSKHPAFRYYAAGALGSIGPNANAAVPALTEALKDDDKLWNVRKAAAKALRKIKG